MSLNESVVEDTALDWFDELDDTVAHGPHLVPGESAAKSACASHADWRATLPEPRIALNETNKTP